MRAVVQRVSRASVEVDGKIVGQIGRGLLVLLAVGKADSAEAAGYMAEKVANLRIFGDDAGKMNRSVLDVGGSVLAVSQFTLYGDARKGRRPSFVDSAPPETAESIYHLFLTALRGLGLTMESGVFQADMKVSLVNDGPVTIMLDSDRMF